MTDLKLKTRNSKPKGGQSIAEYGIIISVVTVALLAMQVYMKRGIQSVVKYSTDQFGNQDYMETDANKATTTDIVMRSVSDGSARVQQEGTGDSFATTYTSDETTQTTGTSVYWQNQEL